MSVGNHTWDHPVLVNCDPAQRDQIESAHRWLVDRYGWVTSFAYQNGDHTEFGERVLEELGCTTAALFDHRAHKFGSPSRIFRIRVNAFDPIWEFKARVSGVHPSLHNAVGRS